MNPCLNPYRPHRLNQEFARCRNCANCRKQRSLDWESRLKLEAAFNPSWPLFFTLTYEGDPPEEADSIANMQKFIRALRRRGHECRYFMVTELGKKNGRLHHHGVLWSCTLIHMRYMERKALFEQVWTHGFHQQSTIKKQGGMSYAVKYMVKGARNYTFSNRPVLGRAGVEYWYRAVKAAHEKKPYNSQHPVPAYISLPVLKVWQNVWIPDEDRSRLSASLGVRSYEPAEHTLLRARIKGVPNGPLDQELLKTELILRGFKDEETKRLVPDGNGGITDLDAAAKIYFNTKYGIRGFDA